MNSRMCAICRVKKPKRELFRFVVLGKSCSRVLENIGMLSDADGTIHFDRTQTIAGRGFYVCGKACWEAARTKKRKVKYNSAAKPARMIGVPDKGFEEMTGE